MKKRLKNILKVYYNLLGKGNFKMSTLNSTLNNLFKEITLKKFESKISTHLGNH